MCILSRRPLSMSLPASLTTDCGGLLNRRSPGRKRCCHTDALHVGYHVYFSHGWFLSRIIEFFFTRSIAESHGSIVPDLRIVEFFFTRMVAEVTVFSHEFSFCPELSNYRIGLFSHGESRRVTVLLSRIIELVYFHTEHRGESRFYCPELSNYRIDFFTRSIAEGHGVLSRIIELSNFSSHGESRRVSGFMSRIIELSNFFSHGESRRFSLSRDMFLVTNLRIIEFLSSRGMSRMVVEVMRVEL